MDFKVGDIVIYNKEDSKFFVKGKKYVLSREIKLISNHWESTHGRPFVAHDLDGNRLKGVMWTKYIKNEYLKPIKELRRHEFSKKED